MQRFFLFTALLFIANFSEAQAGKKYLPEDTSRAKELDEVVVTGQYRPQSARNSVYQVRVIPSERIQKQGATQLQDVLRSELNIRFSQDLATGGTAITLQGLKGQNVKVLVDGLPLIGRQGTTNEVNINQIDVNSIEKIELVEGPLSVIYGADALAGVINIITKKASAAGLNVQARLQEESIGNEYGAQQGIHNQQLGLNWRKGNWDAGAGISHNFYAGWKDTATGRELVWHKRDQRLANGFIGYRKDGLSLRYRFDGLDEIITNPGNFQPFADPSSGDTLAYDQQYLSQRFMQQLQASWFVNKDFHLDAQAAYTNYSRQVFSTTLNKTTGDVRLNIAEGAQSVVKFNGATLRATAYYRLSPLISIQPGIDFNQESGKGERLKSGNNIVSDYAFFASAEITPGKRISVRPGLRFIYNSVYKAPPLVPSLNTKWVLSPSTDLRISYARGFRAPSIRELYFSFFDVNHQVLGNPNLKAETSHSLTGSLNWKGTLNGEKVRQQKLQTGITLSGFYNDVSNMIDYLFVPGSDTAILTNMLHSRTAGSTLSFSLRGKQWQLTTGGGATGFYNDYSATNSTLPSMQWSAEANASLSYRFVKAKLDLNLFYKFTGKRPYYSKDITGEIIPVYLKSYHMADLTLNRKIGKLLTVNAGVKNLFAVDRIKSSFASGGVHTGGGIANIGNGRSYFAGILFNWNK